MSAQTPGSTKSWLVGSSLDCEIKIDSTSVSGRHCRLMEYPDGYVLEDLGSTNGTFVNGYRLSPGSPVYVTKSDAVMLGQRTSMPWPGERPGPGESSALSGAAARADGSGAQQSAITIGRDPASSVHLDYPTISWNHARVLRSGGGFIIEDQQSTNGTSINRIENRITRADLLPSDDVYLGSYKIPASRLLSDKHITRGESAFELVNIKGDRMVLGRDPACDYPLDYPMISWRHMQFVRTPQGIVAEDLGSSNGTFLNGVRTTGTVQVKPGDEIGLGSFRFQILEGGSLAKREYNGNVTIEVAGVAVNAPDGNRLLDPVSLTVFPSEIIALMGPAGAGKTTFLKALNGYTRPAAGRVLFNGQDLYQFYDLFRQQMGYVPQDDIVHAQLKVWEALYFSAKLRTDLKDAEIKTRIDKVLSSLNILDKRDNIIGSPEKKVLSGGQRKRVNIALELINDTPVIFLDEPTSGLSSYDAEEVIKLLKRLAAEGKTIITTIHQPSLAIYKQFDNLIMISRDREKGCCGALAYFGPAFPDSIDFFDPEGAKQIRQQPGKELSPEMLLSGLEKQKTAAWVETYNKSKLKQQFVSERSGKIPSTSGNSGGAASRAIGIGQWITLVRRNFLLKTRDKVQSTILLVQAPVFALLVGGVFRHVYEPAAGAPDWSRVAAQITGIEFLMVVAAIWFGCNNVARDIVGESTVYQRERMVTLKLPSYVFSKVAVAALLALFQCFALLAIVFPICHLKANFLETLGVLFMASMVGSAIGLCISALTETTEAAIAMLPLVLLPIVALGGGIRAIPQIPAPVKQITAVIPSRWAFETNFLKEIDERHDVEHGIRPAGARAFNTQIAAIKKIQFNETASPSKVMSILSIMLVALLAFVLRVLRKKDIA